MPTALPPKTTRADLAAAIYTAIRREKNPPLTRYCILLAVARTTAPMTAIQIGHAIGDASGPAGNLDHCLRHGLLEHSPRCSKRFPTYDLTTKGIEEVARLIHPPTLH